MREGFYHLGRILGSECHGQHSGCVCRAQSVNGVLEDDGLGGGHSEPGCGSEVGLGAGLGLAEVLGGEHLVEEAHETGYLAPGILHLAAVGAGDNGRAHTVLMQFTDEGLCSGDEGEGHVALHLGPEFIEPVEAFPVEAAEVGVVHLL